MRRSSAKIPRSKSLEKAGGARAEERASRGASRLLSPRGCGPRLQPALRGPPGTPRGSPLLPLCSFQGLLALPYICGSHKMAAPARSFPLRAGRGWVLAAHDRYPGIGGSEQGSLLRGEARWSRRAAPRSPRHHVTKTPRVGKVETRRVDGGTQECPKKDRTDQRRSGFPAQHDSLASECGRFERTRGNDDHK